VLSAADPDGGGVFEFPIRCPDGSVNVLLRFFSKKCKVVAVLADAAGIATAQSAPMTTTPMRTPARRLNP
jgi:hypothetical protein